MTFPEEPSRRVPSWLWRHVPILILVSGIAITRVLGARTPIIAWRSGYPGVLDLYKEAITPLPRGFSLAKGFSRRLTFFT
ncbi:hypothetical protein PCE31107_04199 [Pandoraea cepalis]|uniref:Uncharacterized protein n=1 Tax=Pandoraea cepalis TaxID=2508294 RepID=A0A5E4Y0J6_9BURK|nr:hypothetical protein PCE31107_04199 [Pandoraea cepalis]